MTSKKKFLIVCLLFLTKILVAQKVSVAKDSLNKILCRAWKIDFEFSNGKKTECNQIPPNQIYELVFHSDYTFEVIDSRKTTVGIWCYDSIKKHIELELRGENILRIFSIDKKELIMTFKDDRKKNFSNLPESFTRFSPK